MTALGPATSQIVRVKHCAVNHRKPHRHSKPDTHRIILASTLGSRTRIQEAHEPGNGFTFRSWNILHQALHNILPAVQVVHSDNMAAQDAAHTP